ncbi:hypothetical protein ISN44_As09g031760 [Arabidopsis suecica]|uniref:Uncharacterized protein n=1 Tax=Arabidopsis suecica TaxID=45249 RepID=A0A8T2AMT9_ARASU|nr:hypothetical protein ISN44_As09g031760 [Arabidopsis suecica]
MVVCVFTQLQDGNGLFGAFSARFYSKKKNQSTKGKNRKNKWANGDGDRDPRHLFLKAVAVVLGDRRWVDKHVIRVSSGDLGRQIHAYAITYGVFKAEDKEENKSNWSNKEKRLRKGLKLDKDQFKGKTIEAYMYWKEPAALNSPSYDSRSFVEGNLVKKLVDFLF